MGQFYKIKIRFENGNSLELRDSMKLLNYSVDEIAKAFHLDIQKLEIDYNVPRGTSARKHTGYPHKTTNIKKTTPEGVAF